MINILSTFTSWIKTNFRPKSHLISQEKQFKKPQRSQKEFKKQYPNYKIGVNSYGMPSVKNTHPNATLSIGSYCSIANNVEIYLGGQHRTDWISSYPFPAFFKQATHILDYETTHGDVVIGSDVWLCRNCIILSGITIGHGAVVANSAIVTKDIEPYAIVGGNPAKFIRWRFDYETRQALLKSEWWEWPENEILSIVDRICSNNPKDFLEYMESRERASSVN